MNDSLNYALPIPLHYSTHKVSKSHFTGRLLIPLVRLSHTLTVTSSSNSICSRDSFATISFSAALSLGIPLTYIAEGRTSTNSKHISSDPYPLLLWRHRTCAADGHAGNTSRDGHLLLICDVTAPASVTQHTENTACSTVACAYRVYRALACKRVDQIRHNIYVYTS
jgi:hypothetical protein